MSLVRRSIVSVLVMMQLVTFFNILTPATASAQSRDFCQEQIAGFLGLPTWYKYLNPLFQDGECRLDSPRRGNSLDPGYLLKIGMAIFEIVMRVAGIAAIGFVIYGGYQFLVSTGEPDKIAGARTTIINALIGLVIAIFAVAIVNFIGANIT